jgi:hypothetical protein
VTLDVEVVIDSGMDGQKSLGGAIKQPDVWTFEFMPISHLGIPI